MVYKYIPESWDDYNKIRKKAILQGYKFKCKPKTLPAAICFFPLNKTVSVLKSLTYNHGDRVRFFYPQARVVTDLKNRSYSRGKLIEVVETGDVFTINELTDWLSETKDVVFPNKIYTAIKTSRRMYGYTYRYCDDEEE